MSYKINYASFSCQGKVRKNHEDNLYVNGTCLEMVNNGTECFLNGEVMSGMVPVFGVFDGMGGESAGEAAAYVAADTVMRFEKNRLRRTQDTEGNLAYLNRLFHEMNQNVCRYSEEHRIHSMGTTAACILFSDENVCCANVGDSRIYCMDESGITQITTDQVLGIKYYSNPPLLQYIGIKEEDMSFRPDLFALPYHSGDYYLICSDGITDMISDEEIAHVLRSESDPCRALEAIIHAVWDAGARDNATAVLCSVN